MYVLKPKVWITSRVKNVKKDVDSSSQLGLNPMNNFLVDSTNRKLLWNVADANWSGNKVAKQSADAW